MPEVQTISASVRSRMGGWGLLMAITNPRAFRRLLEENFRKALRSACLDVVALIQEHIRTDGEYAENAPLTIARKGSSRPLIAKGDLVRAVAHRVESPWKAEVGVKRITKGGANIAAILHDGFTIDLSNPKYRKMRIFLAIMRRQLVMAGKLAEDAVSPHGKPGFLVVPGRPFFERPFRSKLAQQIVAEAGQAALDATLKGEGYKTPAGRRARLRALIAAEGGASGGGGGSGGAAAAAPRRGGARRDERGRFIRS
jgi:hypothetical protein